MATEDIIRPRRLPTHTRLAKLDHSMRNQAQSMGDVAHIVGELAHVPKALETLAKDHRELRDLFSGERRAYAGTHARDEADIASVKATTERLEKQLHEQTKATEKLGAMVYKAAGALGALGTAIALLKFLVEGHK